MPIIAKCRACLRQFPVGDELGGARVRCATCGAVVAVPGGMAETVGPKASLGPRPPAAPAARAPSSAAPATSDLTETVAGAAALEETVTDGVLRLRIDDAEASQGEPSVGALADPVIPLADGAKTGAGYRPTPRPSSRRGAGPGSGGRGGWTTFLAVQLLVTGVAVCVLPIFGYGFHRFAPAGFGACALGLVVALLGTGLLMRRGYSGEALAGVLVTFFALVASVAVGAGSFDELRRVAGRGATGAGRTNGKVAAVDAREDEVFAPLEDRAVDVRSVDTSSDAATDVLSRDLEALRSPSRTKRVAALRRIMGTPPARHESRRDEVADAVAGMLRDYDKPVRDMAVRALSAWGRDGGRAQLMAAMEERDAPTRAYAMKALAATKDPAVAEALAVHFKDDPVAAYAALVAVGPAAEPAIRTLLASGDPAARVAGFRLVKACAATGFLSEAKAAAADPETPVAVAAREAWRRLAPGELTPLGEALMDLETGAEPAVRRGCEELAAIPPVMDKRAKVLNVLLPVATSDHPEETLRAAGRALARWGGPEVMAALLEHLREDGDAELRHRAMQVLPEFHDPKVAFPVARWMILDAQNATRALVALGPAGEDEVIKLLRQQNTDVRVNACRILAEVGSAKSLPPLNDLAEGHIPYVSAAAKEAAATVRERMKPPASKPAEAEEPAALP